MTRGSYKKGTTVYASSRKVYRVSAKFNMYTTGCVFIYNNTHDYVSVLWNDIRAIIQHVILWQIICNNTKSGIMKTGIIRIQP